MQKHLFSLAIMAIVFMTVLPACSKDDDPTPAETKTELLVKSTWKFEKAEAGIIGDVSSQLDPCLKDNLLIFAAASSSSISGTGTVDEGTTKCDPDDSQSADFSWELINNGAGLRSSVIIFPGGSNDFNIVSLTATNLVLSQQMEIDPYPATTVTVTLKH